jgi:Flp pilus assembly protein CpaB
MTSRKGNTKVRTQSFIAVLLAAAVGLGVFSYSQNLAQTYEDGSVRTEAYFVTREIPEGTPLSDVLSLGFVEKKEVLKDSLPTSAISGEVANDANSFSLKDISAGQILLSSDFGPLQVSTSGLLIPDGKVAISIRLGDVERVSPFLRPGNEVAIFVTGVSKKGNVTITKTIIPKAQIIGIGDSRFIGGQEYIPSGDPSILTIAVSAADAGALIQASKTLSINLALLNRDTIIPEIIIRAESILG